jgi:hypothetical protein
MDLENKKSSFILITCDKIEDIISVLYAKEYKIIELKQYYRGHHKPSIIAYSNTGNDCLRDDAIFILDHFKEPSMVIKYLGEEVVKQIRFDGSESLLEVSMFNTDNDRTCYLLNGVSFSFVDIDRYWNPVNKDDLRDGMIVEYMNNSIWYEKKITNVNEDYDNFFKLLMKYDKVRVKSRP